MGNFDEPLEFYSHVEKIKTPEHVDVLIFSTKNPNRRIEIQLDDGRVDSSGVSILEIFPAHNDRGNPVAWDRHFQIKNHADVFRLIQKLMATVEGVTVRWDHNVSEDLLQRELIDMNRDGLR